MSPAFAHIVFFTLHDHSPQERQAFAQQCHQYLSGHPGTEYFSVGVQSENDRDVNDREYDVALHVVFEDKAAQDLYQVAPRHLQFVTANKHRWASVRIFDSLLTDGGQP